MDTLNTHAMALQDRLLVDGISLSMEDCQDLILADFLDQILDMSSLPA